MRCEFDSNGLYTARWPRADEYGRIYDFATTFLRQEDQAPASAHTVFTEDIRVLTTSSGQLLLQKRSGESQRVLSSEAVKRLEASAKKFVNQIHSLLEATFPDTPERATEWGFEVKQTGRGAGTILLPRDRTDTLQTLKMYIAQEESRPLAEQFKSPVLSDVKAVYDGLSQNLATRQAGQTQRESGTAQIAAVAEELLDLLQAAMQRWGLDVVARTPQPAGDTPPAAGAAPAE